MRFGKAVRCCYDTARRAILEVSPGFTVDGLEQDVQLQKSQARFAASDEIARIARGLLALP